MGRAVVDSVPADVLVVLGFFSSPTLLSVADTETHIMRRVYKTYSHGQYSKCSSDIVSKSQINLPSDVNKKSVGMCAVPRDFLAIAEVLVRADSIVRDEAGFVAAVEAVRVLVVAAVEAAAPVFGAGARVSADV